VVTKPVPPFAIVAGNPARVLRMRDEHNASISTCYELEGPDSSWATPCCMNGPRYTPSTNPRWGLSLQDAVLVFVTIPGAAFACPVATSRIPTGCPEIVRSSFGNPC
jgi:hypothetical protein